MNPCDRVVFFVFCSTRHTFYVFLNSSLVVRTCPLLLSIQKMTTQQPNGTATPTTITANGFAIGVTEDRNRRCRRTMEDAHSFVTDYLNVPRQGFFAIFDGHAGRATAEWCGNNFHRARHLFLYNELYSRSLTLVVYRYWQSRYSNMLVSLCQKFSTWHFSKWIVR